MDLILWRHAEAEDGSPDLARELTAKGTQAGGGDGAVALAPSAEGGSHSGEPGDPHTTDR
mgnify:CR=1 FL=1